MSGNMQPPPINASPDSGVSENPTSESSEGAPKAKCSNCGAMLSFKPGAGALECPYCGCKTPIEVACQSNIKELDYKTALALLAEKEDKQESATQHCNNCGAEVTLDVNVDADSCPFCGSHVSREITRRQLIKPGSVLPFKVTNQQATESFRNWINKLWFAPNKLKKYKRVDKISGIYVPYWTFDTLATTWYTGERGDDYYVTESYRDSNGRTQTRQVKRTRWRRVSGVVKNDFDDILVLAADALPRKYAEKLEPWDLKNLQPFNSDFLSGFRVENYSLGLEGGFERGKEIAEPIIHKSIRRDIGGDHQRISSCNSDWQNISFKHLLLPIWISTYKFKDKSYRFLINARTGEVSGERPYSTAKIALAVLGALAAIGLAIALFMQ